MRKFSERETFVQFVVPFVAYSVFMLLGRNLMAGNAWEPLVRFVMGSIVLLAVSSSLLSRPGRPLSSALIGVAVFVIWIGPDVLSSSYRSHWLLQNAVTGTATSSAGPALRASAAFVAGRVLGSVALVPIVEELFWRGWLMRYTIDNNFRQVPIGTYQRASFWLTAILFASEHGPFWDVGLLAGVAYNWWALRTRNLADCMIAHAVTNACLAIYVVVFGRWQYWL
jgi:CAAX prenyl protease-like protein